MTENEAIKHLQSYAEVVDNMIKYCKDFEPKADITGYLEKKTVFAMAISAFKEVQKYSEIGTVEECKELASMVTTEKKNVLGKIVDEWNEYIEIGTVEECWEAVERQNPKKPKEILRHRGGFEMHHCPNCDTHYQTDNRYTIKDNCCPVCGKLLDSAFRNYCGNCGQSIDTENLEGMEDE